MGIGAAYTWAEAIAFDWCSGDGSLLTPYLLENITIDGGGIDSCILVENSVGVFFTIRNCTLINSGTDITSNAGIKIEYCTNGTITENKVRNHVKNGIMFENSDFNNITNNYIHNSTAGVRLYSSDHNIVLDNNITEDSTVISTTGIYIDSTSEFNLASENYIFNHSTGIEISSVAAVNNTIFNNVLVNNTNYGIWIKTGCNNNTIELNEIRGSNYGLEVSGDGNIFFRNSLIESTGDNVRNWGSYNRYDNGAIGNYWDDYGGSDNDDDGTGDTPYSITIVGGQDNFPIWDDGFNGTAIHIDGTGSSAPDWNWAKTRTWCTGEGTFSNPYLIQDITIDAGTIGSPIFIESSSAFFIIKNCNLTNSQATGDDAGIKFEDVYNAKIIENNITENYAGLRMLRSDNNTISSNYIYDNTGQGIILAQCEENLIEGNIANNSLYYGLLINSLSHNNTVEGNVFGNNKGASGYGSGIRIDYSNDNEISDNQLNDNDQGIRITDNSDDNDFFDNIIHNNAKYGILIQDLSRNCQYSKFYNNSLVNPLGINAYDNGSNSEWDKGVYGNYWSDYGGVDNDDNGFGDIPYNILGTGTSQDKFPVWDDGLNPEPEIILIALQPSSARTFGNNAPTMNLTITDNDLFEAYYTIHFTSTRYYFSPNNGTNIITINQTGWASFDEGWIWISVIVSDTKGNATLHIPFIKEIPITPPPAIPSGNYFIAFMGISIVSLLIIGSRKRKLIHS